MKHLSLALAALISIGFVSSAAAQTEGTVKKAVAAKKAAVKKKVAAKKTAVKAAVEAHTPVQTPTERLSEKELDLAKYVQTGVIPCELGAHVTVKADEANPGFFHVSTGAHRFYMHPVESRTGAMRLEDNRTGGLWLQLGNKSMLMNQRIGQQLANECVTTTQKEFADNMKAQPAVDLFAPKAPASTVPAAPDAAAPKQ